MPLTDWVDETLDALLDRVGVKNWDVVIVGDGSGSTWDRPAGWGSVSIERVTGERKVWAGAMSKGTVSIAEIMAYLQPIEYFASREAKAREGGQPHRAVRVHVITDSEYCQGTGDRGSGRAVKRNAGLWAAFDAFARTGIILKWHWLRRDQCELNKFADALSKSARMLVQGSSLAGPKDEKAVLAVNPSAT